MFGRMPRSGRRQDGDDLVDLVAEFEQLPFAASLIGAAFVLIIFELAAPAIFERLPAGPSGINYGLMFMPIIRILGGAVAAGMVIFGIKGALSRRFDAWDASRRAREVVNRQVGNPASKLTWSELEDLVAGAYGRLSYDVVRRGGSRPDGGVDLELRRAGERVLVQCKHWDSWRVGVRPLRELWGVVASEGATRAVFVTTGTFTPEATAFAGDKALELLDGPAVAALLKAAGGEGSPPRESAEPMATRPCPRCGRPTVRRIAKRGAHAGEAFWGCSGYPDCRQTLPIDG